jgi:DNA-binding GntR family transcriptional regulator
MKKIRVPENLTTQAYRRIREFILEGGMDNRERLTEEFLATQLGISKSPIREALTRLETEGLLRIEPRRGAYLRKYTAKEAEDLYGLREALEVHAIRTARLTPRVVDGLRAHLHHMREHYRTNDKIPWIEEDAAFHNAIAEATGNKLLLNALENLQHQLWLFRRTTYDLTSSNALVAHEEIVKSLERNDRMRAEDLMREHISTSCRQLVEVMTARQSDAKDVA